MWLARRLPSPDREYASRQQFSTSQKPFCTTCRCSIGFTGAAIVQQPYSGRIINDSSYDMAEQAELLGRRMRMDKEGNVTTSYERRRRDVRAELKQLASFHSIGSLVQALTSEYSRTHTHTHTYCTLLFPLRVERLITFSLSIKALVHQSGGGGWRD